MTEFQIGLAKSNFEMSKLLFFSFLFLFWKNFLSLHYSCVFYSEHQFMHNISQPESIIEYGSNFFFSFLINNWKFDVFFVCAFNVVPCGSKQKEGKNQKAKKLKESTELNRTLTLISSSLSHISLTAHNIVVENDKPVHKEHGYNVPYQG